MIYKASEKNYPALIDIWEGAVKGTHDFLLTEDFEFYKSRLTIYFEFVSLYVFKNNEDEIEGFLGVSDDTIEMLFVKNRGIGVGKQLLNFAVNELNKYKVDVNEQNIQALAFYFHFGFREVGKSETDSEGKHYPIIHLITNLKTILN